VELLNLGAVEWGFFILSLDHCKIINIANLKVTLLKFAAVANNA